jgi:hypothetical protein
MHFVMDERYDTMSVWLLQWLAIANAVHSITGPGSSMLRGAGAPMRETIYQACIGILYLGSFYLLLQYWGNTSTDVENSFRAELFLTWPFALAAGSLLFTVLANQYFRTSWFSPHDSMLPLILASIALAWGVHTGWLALGLHEPHGRWDAFAVCVITGGIYSIGFAAAAWFLPGLTRSDREQLIRFIPGAGKLVSLRESA